MPLTATKSPSWLGEPLDEVECRLSDLTPTLVDGQRVPPVRDLGDLGDAPIALLPLVGGVRDRQRDRVVLLAIDDQEWTAVGFLVATLASVQGFRLAFAICIRATPGAAT